MEKFMMIDLKEMSKEEKKNQEGLTGKDKKEQESFGHLWYYAQMNN